MYSHVHKSPELISSLQNDQYWRKKRSFLLCTCRLALERACTAKKAVVVITGLLSQYGQGGPGAEESGPQKWAHHNSFLIADKTEGWILETAGSYWVAKTIKGKANALLSVLRKNTLIQQRKWSVQCSMIKIRLYQMELAWLIMLQLNAILKFKSRNACFVLYII